MKRLYEIAILLFVFPAISHAQEWSTFQNNGELVDNWKIPVKWSPDDIAWKTDLKGYGQSSPVVFDNIAYVTSVVGENKESIRVTAFDITDGTEKWFHEQKNSTPEKNTVMVSRAAPTPVTDKDGLVAFFEGGDIIALNHDGQKRWSRSLKTEFGDLKARHGLAASLEQNNDHVFVWAERSESPFVMALRKSDGSTAWKQPGLGATSWSSPRLIKFDGNEHLVLSAIGMVAGLDPKTGARLWEFKNISGNSSSTPVPLGDNRFLIGSIGARQGQQYTPSCGVIEVKTNNNAAYVANWVWSTGQASCSFGSPVACNKRAYFVNRSGVVHCHDLNSGKQLFVGRLPCSQIWATPLATKDLIYFFGKDGATTIVESANTLKVKQTNKLWTPEKKTAGNPESQDMAQRFGGAVLYAAIAADSKLIMRRGDKLYAVASNTSN